MTSYHRQPPTTTAALGRLFDEYLSPQYVPPEFDTHNHLYAQSRGIDCVQKRQVNRNRAIDVGLTVNGRRGVYAAGSVSKGMLAWLLALRHGPFHVHDDATGRDFMARHVYDIDETVGMQLFRPDVLEPNQRLQLQKEACLRSLFPGQPIIVPAAAQGTAALFGQPEFDRGLKWRDNDWMQLWTFVIRELCDVFPVMGDWFFSGATSGLEYPEAIAMAAGLRGPAPYNSMRFVNAAGAYVPLDQIAIRLAEFLVFAAERRDVFLKHEITAFVRMLAIVRRAARNELPDINPEFRDGILAGAHRLRALEDEILPLVLPGIQAGFFRFNPDSLAKEFPEFVAAAVDRPDSAATYFLPPAVENLARRQVSLDRYDAATLGARDYEFRERARLLAPGSYLARTEHELVTVPLPPLDPKGEAGFQHDGQRLFARPLLADVNERERHQIITTIGGLEAAMPPAGRRLLIIDAGRGQATALPALAHARRHGSHIQQFNQWRARLVAFDRTPQFSRAEGEWRPGRSARQFILSTVTLRRVTDFCLPDGRWEHDDDAVALLLTGTMMQLGLERSSPLDPAGIRVFNGQGHPLSLFDRLRAVTESAAGALAASGTPLAVGERATAACQLHALHRLMREPALRRDTFRRLHEQRPAIDLPVDLRWERIPMAPFEYDHRALDIYWCDRAVPDLIGPVAAQGGLRLHDLDALPDYLPLTIARTADRQIAEARRVRALSHYRL